MNVVRIGLSELLRSRAPAARRAIVEQHVLP